MYLGYLLSNYEGYSHALARAVNNPSFLNSLKAQNARKTAIVSDSYAEGIQYPEAIIMYTPLIDNPAPKVGRKSHSSTKNKTMA